MISLELLFHPKLMYYKMNEEFRKIADSGVMFNHDDTILLAVSGGVDSMVMLNLFVNSDYKFAVAHCNFSLRAEESDGDTAHVTDFCLSRGIKLHSVRFDTHAEMDLTGESVQMAARRLRYDWFEKLCVDFGYSKVAIAHNSGDTIETFFINLVRGTGVRGLTGISAMRNRLIRPIMQCSREDIVSYAVENGVKWRDDSTNSGVKYLRNKLRYIVIPQFKEIEPDFESVMLSNISKVSDSVSFIDRMIREIRDKSFAVYRGRTTISLSIIAKYEPVDFILYELLSPFGFNHNIVLDMVKCYNGGEESKKFNSSKFDAFLTRGLLILTPIGDDVDSKNHDVITDLTPVFHGAGYSLEFDVIKASDIELFNVPPVFSFFDADKITFPLTVRSWNEGDAFVPFGMVGHKKMSDYFVDNKISVLDKAKEKILVNSNGDILWLVGRRSDNRYRVTKNSINVLRVRYIKNNE